MSTSTSNVGDWLQCGRAQHLTRGHRQGGTLSPSPFVFTSERGSPFTTAGWRKMVARLGVAAKLGIKAHPHMFRHACGFQLANQGTDTRTLQAYLGHRNIQHTVRYTELSPTRFKNLWRD
jgi:site-specific recombinase XerD